MSTADVFFWVLHRSFQRFRATIPFSLGFKLLNVLLVTPIVVGSLRLLLQQWGRASVGNFEIASFLLSPPGLLAMVGFGVISLATLYLELAGLMRLLADERLVWWQALIASGRLFRRLMVLGRRQLVFYLVLAVPFLVGIGLIYGLLWSGRDLNGLIVLKPPVFWYGAGLAGALGLLYVMVAGRWFLQWLFAVPALLFEPDVSVVCALQMSIQRTNGQLHRLLLVLVLWLLAQAVLNFAVFALLRIVSASVLRFVGESLALALPTTAGLLVVHGLAATMLTMFSTMTFAGLVLALYQQAVGESLPVRAPTDPVVNAAQLPLGWILAGGLLALAVMMGVLSHQMLQTIALDDRTEITAHRAGAKYAPENSVAALRRAITDHADWAEVDVQLTQDQALVILHDIDLARIGGGSRRVDAITLAEIRALDIGALFSPDFAGELVPTLDEILDSAGRQIRLNVELKPHGKADESALTERVVSAIQKAGMVDRCRLCSQSYASLQRARRLEPSLPVGFIAATAVGDLTELDVDFLMVKSELATRTLVERAGVRKIQVHAWTVNNPAELAPLLDRGVANVITDDPAGMRRRLDEIRTLSPAERLLLRVRSELISEPR